MSNQNEIFLTVARTLIKMKTEYHTQTEVAWSNEICSEEMKRFLQASKKVSCYIPLEPTEDWGFTHVHIKTQCWLLYREILGLDRFH